jgi:SAM-dependent methyltransferase
MQLECIVCGEESADVPLVAVPSNTRAFRHESHRVWRCPRCVCVHAYGKVDLDHYYADYPFHADAEPGWWGRAVLRNQVRRLRAAGLIKGQRVLDYGCGAGHLVRALRMHDHQAEGYDAYVPAFSDKSALIQTYDMVVSQDVIEHVLDPLAHLKALHEATAPGGLIAIGTPAAEHLDLKRPERFKHGLHQPWHRHILSSSALIEAGEARGWTVVTHYRTQYINTWLPTVNVAWLGVVVATSDGTIDAALEAPRLKLWLLLPLVAWIAFFGVLLAPKTDGMVVFRRGAEA